MNDSKANPAVIQLTMEGMSTPKHMQANAYVDHLGVLPGQEVMFLGKVIGGPLYGSFGIVKRAFPRKALVDMGLSGTWHVPYYFLGLPEAA